MKNKSILMGLFVAAAGVVFYMGADSACNQKAVIDPGALMSLGGITVENKKASLVRVCDTPVKENLVSFVLIKDGLRVGGVVDKSHIALIGE